MSGVIHIIPSLTTYPGQNPSFRVYTVDKATFTLLDYKQYRLVIKEQNNNEAKWKVAYRFTEFYEVPNMDYSHFPKFVKRMQNDKPFFESFIKHMWAEGFKSARFLSDHKNGLQFITCRLLSSDMYTYLDCIGNNYMTLDYFFGYGFVAKYLSPKWGYAYYE